MSTGKIKKVFIDFRLKIRRMSLYMKKVTITDKQKLKLEFDHISGGTGKFEMVQNPLTGDWLETHSLNGKNTSYYSDNKTASLVLANKIIRVSAERGLKCTITISSVK